MIIGITGSSGLVGTALARTLTAAGHEVVRLVRPPGPRSDPAEVRNQWTRRLDAVVHLAGENIASRRWSAKQKDRISRSRIQGTRFLSETLSRLDPRPGILVSASAVGYYGDRSGEILTEESPPGTGFLADVCRKWEEATSPASAGGIRVVCLRTGLVLTPAGGALKKLLLPFRLGLGGPTGSGRQFMSWITLDDLVGVILHALATDTLAGPVNATAPDPVTNREFARVLGRVLGRPARLPFPAVAAKLLFGEMAEALLLSGCRVHPARLEATGFAFRHPRLEEALRFLLGRAG